MSETILKCIFLFLAITYSFTCIGRLIRGGRIPGIQTVLMSIGIVGFIAMQFWI